MKKLEIIRKYYESRMGIGLPDYGVLGWESEEAQNLRFEVLLSAVELEGKALLDVGCGMGNLLQYLKSKGLSVAYTGTDILESMIEQARLKNPGAAFHHLDIFKNNIFKNNSFDIAYASGIFNIDLGNNSEFLLKALALLLDLSREAVVFNLLHRDSPGRESGYSYFHPDDIKSMVEGMQDRVERLDIIEAYLSNDFTVVCRKRTSDK
jgi:SAM-dependent methyltransferase